MHKCLRYPPSTLNEHHVVRCDNCLFWMCLVTFGPYLNGPHILWITVLGLVYEKMGLLTRDQATSGYV